MASFTRNFVASATNSLPDNTNETVDLETPARRHPARTTQGSTEADGICVPVYACDALVLGHAKSPRRHIRVLGIGRADPAYGCDRPAWRSRLPQPSALAAPWTKIRPMWKRW